MCGRDSTDCQLTVSCYYSGKKICNGSVFDLNCFPLLTHNLSPYLLAQAVAWLFMTRIQSKKAIVFFLFCANINCSELGVVYRYYLLIVLKILMWTLLVDNNSCFELVSHSKIACHLEMSDGNNAGEVINSEDKVLVCILSA